MVRLITAEQARTMRETALDTFVEKEMDKYIKYINKKITEETKKGMWGLELWYAYYSDISPDPVISELSKPQLNRLINILEVNGYRAYLDYDRRFVIYWDIVVEPEPVNEEPKKIPWWKFWSKQWYY